MNEIARTRLRVAIALATIYVVWGSTYLAIRYALESFPPLLMGGVRFLTAGLLLYAWARVRGAERPSLRQWRSAAVIGGFLLLGGNGAVGWAEQTVETGTAALLISTVPLWMTLFDWLTEGRRPGRRVLAGLALGIAGVALLVRPGTAVDPAGALVLVLGASSWAWGSLRSRRMDLPASPLVSTALQMICGGALLAAAGTLRGEVAVFDPAAASLRSVLAVAYLAVFGSIVAFSAYVWLLRKTTPAIVGTYAYVNPVIAVLLGWLAAGESISAGTLVATAVIVAGVAAITSGRARRPPRPSTRRRRETCAAGSAAERAA